jgi:hypothetical protein
MRLLSILVSMLLIGVPCVFAQADDATSTPDRGYKLLREDEDWSFLRDRDLRQDFWDPIKYVPLRNDANDWYLTLGGEAREVWQQIGNDNWGPDPYWNAYFDERYVLLFDMHYGKHFVSFVELKSGLSSFRIGGPRPIDEKTRLSDGIFRSRLFRRLKLDQLSSRPAGDALRFRAFD